MESIQELRGICQTSRLWADTWHGRNIARFLSIYITRVFLQAGMSANFATGVFLMCGVLGGLSLLPGTRMMFLLGGFMLQLSYVIDHVDGEIARYRKQTSLTGMYFDHIAHYIIHPLFFFCLGLGLFFREGGAAYLYLGILGGLSVELINIIPDIYDLTIAGKVKAEKTAGGEENKPSGPLRKAFSCLHIVCTFPVIMDTFFLAAILDLISGKSTVAFLLWFYSVGMFLVWALKLSYLVMTRKIDKECGAA